MGTEKIAEFIVNTHYEKIPVEAISIAKMCLLDGFGVALAGTRELTGKIITEYVRDISGKPESGIIGGCFKTSSPLSALANGTLAHALDYDDEAITWEGHPTVVLLPAIFALAERDHLSGRKVLEAYIIGWEVGSKLCSELSFSLSEQGWHPTATIGTLASTAACANLLGLNVQQTQIALGIAASEASGLRKNFGTDTKPFHAGRAASNAITATMLAQKGFTANQTVLEDGIGFCQVMAKKECNLETLARALGSPFDIVTSYAIKPYPSCALTHRCIDAMLYLVEKYQIRPDQVAEIECHTPVMMRKILVYSQPQTGLQLHGRSPHRS
jgi:2-methylcitrate dehydratase PrpD